MNLEAEILLCCSRSRPAQHVLDRLPVLLDQNLDWASLLSAASLHGVMPLLYSTLRKVDMRGVPDPASDILRDRARANARRSLLLTAELLRLTKHFHAAGIPAIPFKGPVLAASAYGDVTLRQFGDLDILVKKKDLPEARRLLLSLGYWSKPTDSRSDPDHVAFRRPQYYTFVHQDGLSRVDLQWRVAETYFVFSLDREQLWSSLAAVSLPGYTVYTFDPTDMLLVLCVHGSKHRWEKLKWICDVSEFVRAHRDTIDWQVFQRRASTFRAGRMAGLGLLLAKHLLDADVPEPISRLVEEDAGTRMLANHAHATLFGARGRPAAAPTRILFYLRATDRWQDRALFSLRYVSQAFLAIFTPSAVDAAALPLPKYFWFLHYFFRPMRLMFKYVTLATRGIGSLKSPM